MTTLRRRVAAALVVTAITVACDDVPLLPQWDTDIYAPLGSDNVTLPPAGTPIPANSSAAVPGDIRTVDMDGFAGDIIGEVINDSAPNVRLEVRVTKTANLAVTLADTVYLAADAPSLATTTIANGVLMGAGETSIVDTLALGPNAVNLLRQLWQSNGTLHLQARGRVVTGGSGVTIQAGDSIHVRVGILVRVPIAGGGN